MKEENLVQPLVKVDGGFIFWVAGSSIYMMK
jgi:hypothetical protein